MSLDHLAQSQKILTVKRCKVKPRLEVERRSPSVRPQKWGDLTYHGPSLIREKYLAMILLV
jgi:hypothetical protein